MKPEFKPYADTHVNDSESDESGLELNFLPEEDMSSLECSVATSRISAEPDGYKSDDVSTPALPVASRFAERKSRSSKNSRRKLRQQASSRKENRPALDPVDEQSVDTEPRGSQIIKSSPPNSDPKQKIKEIMNRGVQDGAPVKSKSMKHLSNKGDDSGVSRAHQVAKSFSQHAGRADNDSSIDGGPPTIDPNQEEDLESAFSEGPPTYSSTVFNA